MKTSNPPGVPPDSIESTYEELVKILDPLLAEIRLGNVECFCVAAVTCDGRLIMPSAIRPGKEVEMFGALEYLKQCLMQREFTNNEHSSTPINLHIKQTRQ